MTSLGFATELVLGGRVVTADEALARGLIDAMYDPVLDKAVETAHESAAHSAAKAPPTISMRDEPPTELRIEPSIRPH